MMVRSRMLWRIVACVCALAGVGTLRAQTEAADYSRIGFGAFLTATASDYQCVGINPANLGFVPEFDVYIMGSPIDGGMDRAKRNWSFTVAEGGFATHSDALKRGDLWDAVFQSSSFDFTPEQKLAAARAFADNGLRFSADIIPVAVSYQSDKWGGLALTVHERVSGTFIFNESASRLAFEGRYYDYFDSTSVNYKGDTVGYARNPQTYAQLFEGTRLAMTWYRELGLSYGLKVLDVPGFRLYAGATAKYLMGYAYMDAEVRDHQLMARSSLSPVFGISYGKAVSPSFIPGKDFRSVGNGWGLDIGLTAEIGLKWTISASVVDLGAMRWDGNVFIAKDTILNGVSSTGFNNYNIFEEAPKITGEGNFFSWNGLSTATSELASRIRGGISYYHTSRWRFGIDAVVPFNRAAGSLGEPIVSGGVDWRPLIWLRVSTGFGGGGNMGTFIPIGAMASLFGGVWEFGLSSRDIITLFTTKRPVLSLCVGLMRIRL